MSDDLDFTVAGLDAFRDRVRQAQYHNLGFPGATDMDHHAIGAAWWNLLLNNVGDPAVDGLGVNHTKPFELAVIEFVADVLRAPTGRWGYITSGATEGTLHALYLARRRFPTAVVYYSTAAHPSVAKATAVLGVDTVVVRTQSGGELDYQDLAAVVGQRRDRPAIVVATAGTTFTEAVDDLHQILAVLDGQAVTRRFVHVDAALAGIPLGLLSPEARPGFDFGDGADSIVVSGHKFLGAPMPCGVLVTRTRPDPAQQPRGAYAGSPDSTLLGSRNGHTALILAHIIHRLGRDGLQARVLHARSVADYAVRRLAAIGWPAWRHPQAFTVVLRRPPALVCQRWVVVSDGADSVHIVCMPGVTTVQIDEFVADLYTALNPQRPDLSPSMLDGRRPVAGVQAQRAPAEATT